MNLFILPSFLLVSLTSGVLLISRSKITSKLYIFMQSLSMRLENNFMEILDSSHMPGCLRNLHLESRINTNLKG